MECPFLREAKVKYCQASPFRKMILQSADRQDLEKCSSSDYASCAAAASRMDVQPLPAEERCPFLEDAFVEYCGAASVTKFVPASNALLSRCKSDGHLYCELFLTHADPAGERLPQSVGGPRDAASHERMPVVEGVPVPARLWYAPNHMWLDVAPDGYCHIGVDGFLARIIGKADHVSFPVSKGAIDQPVAVLTVNGTDLRLVFPNLLHHSAANFYLRTNPAKLTADPYGAGWLFEGAEPAEELRRGGSIRKGLIGGHEAVEWFRGEADHLEHFVHDRLARPGPDGTTLMADGGRVEPGVAAWLEREDLVDLFTEFFSRTGWRR